MSSTYALLSIPPTDSLLMVMVGRERDDNGRPAGLTWLSPTAYASTLAGVSASRTSSAVTGRENIG